MTYNDLRLDEHIEVSLPLTCFLFIIHILCSLLNMYDIDASHKHHDFQGFEGWVLFVMKLSVWLYLLFCYSQTEAKDSQRAYFKRCFLLGSVYMLTVPATICCTFMFAPYERQKVFDLVSHWLSFSTNAVMMFQVAYKNSMWCSVNLN